MKLITVRNYANQKGYSVQYVYRLIKDKKIDSKEIDGVKFIKIKEWKPTKRNKKNREQREQWRLKYST